MIDSTITGLIKILELAPRYLAAISVASGFVLFGSPEHIEALGLSDFAKNQRSWVGSGFIISITVFFIFIVLTIWNRISLERYKKRLGKSLAERLKALTENEKQIIRYYVIKNTRSNNLNLECGIVKGLESAGIIHRASSVGSALNGFAYHIDDAAWDYINKNKRLLIGTTDTYRSDDVFNP